MYRVELSLKELSMLHSVLAERLAELGRPEHAEPHRIDEIVILTRLIPRVSAYQQQGTPTQIELAPQELMVADRSTANPPHFSRHLPSYPRGTASLLSLRRKLYRLSRPPWEPLAIVRVLVSRIKIAFD